MFGMVFTGVTGTISSPTPMWRSFDTGDVNQPNAWSTVTNGTSVTTDTSQNKSAAITTTGKLLAQAGLRYSTSGTSASAVVDVVVAAKA